jgi:hypothetical protein
MGAAALLYFAGNLLTIKYEYEMNYNDKVSNYLYQRSYVELVINLLIVLTNCIFIIIVLRKNRNKNNIL